MGFWHTGYIEFHEPSGLDVGYRPSKVWYPCRHCTSKFDTMEDLRRHRFEAHPLARPMLFVQGAEVGATPFRVTRQLTAADIQLDKATKATLNGKPIHVSKEKDLPTTWDDYLGSLKQSKRGQLRKALRALEQWAGGQPVLEFVRSPEQLAKGQQILLALHKERWASAGPPSGRTCAREINRYL